MGQFYKLIFALSYHIHYGYIVEAYRIGVLKNGQWSVDVKKINDIHSRHLQFDLNDFEQDILHSVQNYHDENILAHFSLLKEKKPTANKSYFTDLSLSKNIIPYVSELTSRILCQLRENNIPVYLKNEEKGEIYEVALGWEMEPAEPRFKFNLANEEFTYCLELFHCNNELPIEKIKIITQTPGIVQYENSLYFLPIDFNGILLRPFQKNKIITIPKIQIQSYLKTFVSKIVKKYHVEVTGFTVSDKHPEAVPVLSLAQLQKSKPAVQVSFRYDDAVFFPGANQDFNLNLLTNDQSVSFVKIYRNREQEKIYLQKIAALGFTMINQGFFYCGIAENGDSFVSHNVLQLIQEISKKSFLLRSLGAEIEIQLNDKKYVFDEPVISSSVSLKNDWFDLQMNIRIGEHEIPFQKIIPNIIKGKIEYELSDGSVFIIPNEWFSRFKDISVLCEQGNQSVKINKSQFSLVEAFSNEHYTNLSDQFKRLTLKQIPELDLPLDLQANLREYQKRGFEWLMYLHESLLGGCLADDMGLGKTVQILTYFLKVLEQKLQQPPSHTDFVPYPNEQLALFSKSGDLRRPLTHLIVCPLSLIHNWLDEINKFAPSLQAIVYTGPERYPLIHKFDKYDIVLSTYGIIRNDSDVLKHIDFHTIVLDESQYIKNPESKSYEALCNLNSQQRFVLTGTPLENSLTDLWTQMSFLNPGILGSLKSFRDSYVIPLEKNDDKDVALCVQKIIHPFILRRTKKEVTPELPPITEKICYCNMTEEQKIIYEKKKSEIRNFLIEHSGIDHRSRRNMIVLSGLMKLRLIANHPKLSDPDYTGKSGKFDEICDHIHKVISEGHKTIIFSQFVKHLNIIKQYLDYHKIRYNVLTGQTTQLERQKQINSFQKDPEISIFLMTLKAGGVGLNLTQADYVFMVDPWWNPASENQAINRTHRIGQDKKVFSYKFITYDTIEEKILRLQNKKSELFNNIINSSSFARLNEEELINLFN